jgi:subtilase family serine protease
VPRTGNETTLNADLYFSGSPFFERSRDDARPDDNILICGEHYRLHYAVHNEGFEATPLTNVVMQFINARTGTVSIEFNLELPSILPGETRTFIKQNIDMPTTFINESHILRLRIDTANLVLEANENNNLLDKSIFLSQFTIGGCTG